MHPSDRARLDLLRRWANVLDNYFQVPGTRIRFGIDAIIGLVPGIGDLSAPIFAAFIIVSGLRMRVPPIVLARMVLNAALDATLGLVPFLGDVADVFWKANLRNLALLERHAIPGIPPSPGDYVVVIVCLIVLVAMAVLPILLAIWLLTSFALI